MARDDVHPTAAAQQCASSTGTSLASTQLDMFGLIGPNAHLNIVCARLEPTRGRGPSCRCAHDGRSPRGPCAELSSPAPSSKAHVREGLDARPTSPSPPCSALASRRRVRRLNVGSARRLCRRAPGAGGHACLFDWKRIERARWPAPALLHEWLGRWSHHRHARSCDACQPFPVPAGGGTQSRSRHRQLHARRGAGRPRDRAHRFG